MDLLIKFYAIFLISILIALTQYKCNINRKESPLPKELILQKMTPIKVPEPSALTLSFDGKYFWSVCDENSKVYRLTKNGTVTNSFIIDGEDLEGITVIDVNRLAVILERSREVVIIDTLGNEVSHKGFNLEGNLNEGLEGISYDSKNKIYYLLNEKNPGLLIKADSSFNELSRKVITFADDYSDIFYAIDDNTLWILSDESKRVFQTDLNGNKLKEFFIEVDQPEGLVVDYKNKLIYVVSDKKEELYEFKLP
ncbi:MAG: SdiA-regulated domain-containing protein [Ignavibacteriales bacterium]|nr:SdiA-regulated domain-containing protein [Ignavibacteriales bacterium]